VLVQPISTNGTFGLVALDTIRGIKEGIPGVHTTCGLSNVSFGLPERRLLNRAFAVALVSYGMDTLIIDPLDSGMMAMITAIKTLLGQDEFCVDYLAAYRNGRLSNHTGV